MSPSPSRPLQLGSVVWAELEDPNGYRKVRPGVVVTPTADIRAGKPVRVVAITTRLSNRLPDDYVLLPWDRQGKARSGLRRRCAAVASWQAEIPVGAVQQEVGILPPQAIGELLTKISAALPPSRQHQPQHLRLATRPPSLPQPHRARPLPPPEMVREGIARARALDETANVMTEHFPKSRAPELKLSGP